jgi:NAD(P)-dependent dehydrogenase (short-subunit alcohol dehydrogenase family)
MQALNGRIFAVTGTSGNLGRAVVDLLVARGAQVVRLERSTRDEGQTSDQVLTLGGLDMTDASSIAQALDGTAGRFGALHGLVAAAGGFDMGGTSAAGGWSVWDAMLTANLKTVVAATQAIVPRLAEGGRIVTVGARPALSAPNGLSAYAASKAAVLRLTESLSEELKGRDITVNSVLPSVIDTPQNRAAMPKADHSVWVPPQDIAEVIAFLLSHAARSVTGAHIPVYGRT